MINCKRLKNFEYTNVRTFSLAHNGQYNVVFLAVVSAPETAPTEIKRGN